MATLALGILGTKVTSLAMTIGADLLISSISTTTSSIGSAIKYLSKSSQKEISEILELIKEIDLEFTINVVEHLIKEQNIAEVTDDKNSVKKALIGVSEILDVIHIEFVSIMEAVDNHNKLYFNKWRKFSWNGDVETVKKHNNILLKRCKMLFELLKIYAS